MKTLFQVFCIVLALLCFGYGSVVRAVGSGTRFWLVWWAGTGFFALVALALRLGWFARLPKPALYAFLGVIAAGLLYVAVCTALVFSHFHDAPQEAPDVILVLGAQVYPSGPSIILQHRLDTALDVLYAYPETKCIVTGGQGENEHAPEAQVMRDYLIANGIDPARIQTEEASKNTIDNIRNSMALLDPVNDTVGIVTNNFHLYRALSIAEKQGIPNAVGIAAPSRVFYLPHNVLRECVGILKDKLMGNM
ncbi:MAG: YdcF family protein [Lachnospiraceae bacterium]|nr:YdcF family protein [Lachnospiraceae bacterium]